MLPHTFQFIDFDVLLFMKLLPLLLLQGWFEAN